MKAIINKSILSSAIAIALGLTNLTAFAQEGADNHAEDNKHELDNFERILVTGVTRKGVTELESSVAVTIVDRDLIDREQPIGVGDALDMVPGLFVENSAGEIGINISPRGLQAGDQQRFVSYQEDGLPVSYTGEFPDQLMRMDIMTDRIDVIRGGTSGILTVNGPGALVNFLTRKGGDKVEGDVRLTLSDYGTYRSDFFVGAPINEDWKLAFGGFYRTSDGERDAGFTGNRGGQFRLNLTREFENGFINVNYKNIDDNVIFYLPVPLQNQSNPKAIPGFDPLTDTLLSPDTANVLFKRPNGNLDLDLRNGADNKVQAIGFEANFSLNDDWSFINKARFTKADITFNGNFPGGNGGLVLAEDVINPAINSQVAELINLYGGTPQLRYTSSGEQVNNLAALNGNGLTTTSFWGYAQRNSEEFANDLSLTYESENNSLTFGTLLFNTKFNFLESGARFLSDVKGQVNRLDIVTVDSANEVLGSLTDNSFLDYGVWYGHNIVDSKSLSLYVNDSYQVTEELLIDAGIRWEKLDIKTSVEQTVQNQDLNPNSNNNENNNVIADNTLSSSASGFYVPYSGSLNDTSWTLGFNYTLSDTLALYGRYANSFDMPRIYNSVWALSGNRNATQNEVDAAIGKSTKLDLTEFGLRYNGDDIALSATLFQTVFHDLTVTVRESGNPFSTTIKTETTGVEFDMIWTPIDNFTLELAGVAQNAKIKGIPSGADEAIWNGNQIQRTPEVNLRVTPSYNLTITDRVNADAYVTIQHTGKRFADLANNVALPAYTTVDAGVIINIDDDFVIQFKGNNLFNEVALTEGSPRSGLDQTAASYYYARPKFGRNFTASFTYSF